MSALTMYICKHCGIILYFSGDEEKKCSCEEPDFISLNINPVEYRNMSETQKTDLIKTTLNLNDQQYEEQKEIWHKVREPIEQKKQEKYKTRSQQNHEREILNKVRCPYCNSVDVSKISTLGRAASVGVFGLASKKIGKQWHCNHCKSDF